MTSTVESKKERQRHPKVIKGDYGYHWVGDLGLPQRVELIQRFEEADWRFVVGSGQGGQEYWIFKKCT